MVIGCSDSLVSFLTCYVPNLKLDSLFIFENSFDFEIDPNGADEGRGEGVIRVTEQKRCFPHTAVANDEQFEHVVKVLIRGVFLAIPGVLGRGHLWFKKKKKEMWLSLSFDMKLAACSLLALPETAVRRLRRQAERVLESPCDAGIHGNNSPLEDRKANLMALSSCVGICHCSAFRTNQRHQRRHNMKSKNVRSWQDQRTQKLCNSSDGNTKVAEQQDVSS